MGYKFKMSRQHFINKLKYKQIKKKQGSKAAKKMAKSFLTIDFYTHNERKNGQNREVWIGPVSSSPVGNVLNTEKTLIGLSSNFLLVWPLQIGNCPL